MTGGLDAFPSLARLKELHRARTGQELVLDGSVPVRDVVVRASVRKARAEHLATLGVLVLHQRVGDRLRLVLNLAPRTKKNGRKGGFAGIKQGPAYRAYRDAIVEAIAGIKDVHGLPLPEQPYNIAVTYYVDVRGKRADKCGLDQGLYDALENAGVVTNDWQFRTDDGTRIVAGDPSPRVELVITPIQEGQHG